MSLLTGEKHDTEELRAAHRVRCTRLVRDGLNVLSSKWAVGVLLALGDGARRYHEILAELEPISEKVLTQTLRTMERDGLIARLVHPEVPPRVEYSLTPLGRSLAALVHQIESWVESNYSRMTRVAREYDAATSA